jgi:hypothetical protein
VFYPFALFGYFFGQSHKTEAVFFAKSTIDTDPDPCRKNVGFRNAASFLPFYYNIILAGDRAQP